MRKCHIVDALIMAGVAQLRGQSSGVDPVYVGLRSPAEEVCVVTGEGERSNIAHNLRFFKEVHILDGNASQFALASSHKQVPVLEGSYSCNT